MAQTATFCPKRKKLRWQDVLFYCSLLAWGVIQFSIMWVGVNVNSLLLSFKTYDVETLEYSFAGFRNFSRVLRDLAAEPTLVSSLRNSVLMYALSLLFFPVSIFTSFFIYKKLPGSGFFKVILYVPSFISGVVLTYFYKVLADRGYPAIVSKLFNRPEPLGLFADTDKAFTAVLCYHYYFSVGGNILMYVGAMLNIDDSVVEAARLDGANLLREFIHVTLPGIYGTIAVFLTVGVPGLFTADPGLFLFFDLKAPSKYYTFGYFMFKGIKGAVSKAEYPYYAAFGILMTLVAAPLTFFVRWILNKKDPNE